MNLFRCMQAFILTVKTGSFAAASVSLNTSPQMIAKYIAFLENYLGLKLLNRTTRSQNLTEFGKQYYPVLQLRLLLIPESHCFVMNLI